MQSLFYFNIYWKCLFFFFLITTDLKCTSEVKLKRIRTELLKEKYLFYFSVKDLFNNFGKSSKNTGLTWDS